MLETIEIAVPGGKRIAFVCASGASVERAKLTLSKEPGTIAWIDSFQPRSVFWDIGANIGTYALYAAIQRDCTAVAFEPAANNFAALSRNIVANGLDRRVRALPVAVDERCKAADMHMMSDLEGSALHVFGNDIDYTGKRFSPSHLQGVLGVPVDALVSIFGLPIPNYVKIDVDGLEQAVVSGGVATFANPACQSILVELDLDDEAEVQRIETMLSSCNLHRDDMVEGNKPRPHKGALVYNMIFRRRPHVRDLSAIGLIRRYKLKFSNLT